MKKRIISTVFIFIILFGANLAHAQTNQQEYFYNSCIDKRIAECEIKASMADTQSPYLQRCAEINLNQAQFYMENRDELVKQMVAENLGMKAHEVDHFLIKVFFTDYPKELASTR